MNHGILVPMFEMSENQKALFDNLTTLQQEISLNSFSGMNDIDSYKNSSGKAEKENAMSASVSEILSNPKVVAFLDSMKAVAVSDAIMSREEMMETLTAISKVDLSRLDKLSPEAMEGLESSFGVKLKAMNQLADLGGYKSASKHDHTSSDGSMSPKGKNLDDFYADSKG